MTNESHDLLVIFDKGDDMPKETFFNLDEEKQEKVMRAAISQFMKNGFEKGNIGEIAKSAGVAKGSIYQYFENKKELFLYSVQWATEFTAKKYSKYMCLGDNNTNLFHFVYENSKNVWKHLSEEREIIIFIQDVFLGKYSNLTDQSMERMMKISDEHILKLIRDGKKNGSIRKDIDDNIILIFLNGTSLKYKEHIMNKARMYGEDIIDEDFKKIEKELLDFLELLKNGMGAK